MTQIKADDIKTIKSWLDEHDFFDCDCFAIQENDTGAWIHQEFCSSWMDGHCEIVLTRLIEWLEQSGPIEVRGW